MNILSLSATARASLTAILAHPQGRKVGVMGLGVSGRAMAAHLVRRGAHVVGVDANPHASVDELRSLGVEVRLGQEELLDVEALAISPGVNPRREPVQKALRAGIPVCGELELAGRLPAAVLAITGTNGKSTTTALAGALAEGLGHTAFVGGNFGEPVVSWLDSGRPVQVAVLELSSYQLETAYTFAPQTAVVLNVTTDHLARHETMENYAAVKEHLVTLVPPEGVVLLNADDQRVAAMERSARAKVLWFSARGQSLPGPGAIVRNNCLEAVELAGLGSVSLAHPTLLGRHNQENALAAILAMFAMGLAPNAAATRTPYVRFAGLPHRLELAGEMGGVRYINDSKATNDASAATGLQAFQQAPVWLLAGGKDKGGGYQDLLVAAHAAQLRGVLAFGEAAGAIAAAFAQAGMAAQVLPTMLDACEAARAQARTGDVVLLSPACASFDAFLDYAHRGRVFVDWVHKLGEGM